VSSAFTIIPPSDVSIADLSLVEMEAAIGELLLSLLGVAPVTTRGGKLRLMTPITTRS
jgi:hypothetical protein